MSLAAALASAYGASPRGWAGFLSRADFIAELLYTAIPQRAASGTTATFTRATTKTWPNNDGNLVTGVAGEIGFVGARRVRNLLASVANLLSEDLTSAGWTANAVTKAVGSITETAASSLHYISNNAVGTIGRKHIYQMRASLGSGTRLLWTGDGVTVAEFNLQAGTAAVVAGSGSASMTLVSTGVYDCYLTINSQAATVVNIGLASSTGVYNYAGNGTSSINVSRIQVEDITGQTTQTAGEYVSVGVESAPYYHGSMVDGVKCFPTDLSGNPLTTMLGYSAEGARTNVLLHSNDLSNAAWSKPGPLAIAQNEIGVDGAISAWTLTDDNVGVDENVNQASVKTAATWTDSCYFKKTTGAQATYPVFYAFDGATRIALCTVDTTNGVATVWTAYTGFTVQPSVARCRSFNDDKWFVELSFTATAATWTTTVAAAGTTNATQSTGTLNAALTGSCVIERLQSELGSFASPYIAATTIAVARNKDEESVSTSGNIAAAAGSIYLEYTPTHAPSGTVAFWGTYVDADNYTAILHDATNLIFRKRIAGVNYDATIANAFVSGTTYKACATWGASGTSITLNGTEGTPHANTTAAQIGSTMQWGADGNSLQQPFAYLRNCRDWLRQLSASERVAVTA